MTATCRMELCKYWPGEGCMAGVMPCDGAERITTMTDPENETPEIFQGPDRAEHLQWCKDRALAYADRGEVTNAVASMCSDLRKHPGTENHAGAQLLVMEAVAGLLDRPGELRRCIEGFS